MTIGYTLSRYIGRSFLVWLGLFFGILAAIILSADLIELLRRAASRPDTSFGSVMQLALLKLPNTAQLMLPFAVLFAALMSFWRLSRTSELVVARAVGVSVWQFVRPAIVLALLVGVLKVGLINEFSSVTFARYEQMEPVLLRGQVNQAALAGGNGLWLRQGDDEGSSIIHAGSIDALTGTMGDVMVLQFKPDGSFRSRLDATRAVLSPGRWVLEDARAAIEGQPPQPVGVVELPTDFTLARIQDSFARPETMSFWALPAFIDGLEKAGFSALRHRLYLQSQFAVPILMASMVLIAAAFALRPQRRGGIGQLIAAGVGAGFIVYFLSDLVQALGLSATIPVSLAAWAPATVSTLMGVTLLLYLEDG
jgi:lipopolysaccharide export system permease protein